MPLVGGNGRRITELFFTRETPESNVYICKCGTERKKTSSSFQNLVSHVVSAHPDYNEIHSAANSNDQLLMEKFFTTSKSSSLCGWFDLVINAQLPFSFVENTMAKPHVRREHCSLSTFMRYLSLLTKAVEKKN